MDSTPTGTNAGTRITNLSPLGVPMSREVGCAVKGDLDVDRQITPWLRPTQPSRRRRQNAIRTLVAYAMACKSM